MDGESMVKSTLVMKLISISNNQNVKYHKYPYVGIDQIYDISHFDVYSKCPHLWVCWHNKAKEQNTEIFGATCCSYPPLTKHGSKSPFPMQKQFPDISLYVYISICVYISRNTHIYIYISYVYIYTHILCIYLYIYRERDREKCGNFQLPAYKVIRNKVNHHDIQKALRTISTLWRKWLICG